MELGEEETLEPLTIDVVFHFCLVIQEVIAVGQNFLLLSAFSVLALIPAPLLQNHPLTVPSEWAIDCGCPAHIVSLTSPLSTVFYKNLLHLAGAVT